MLFSHLCIKKNSVFFLSGTDTGGTKILVNRQQTCLSELDLICSFTIFDKNYTEKVRIDQIKVKGERIFVNLCLTRL